MKNSIPIKLLSIGCLLVMIQACSIPKATLKEPDTTLPKGYPVTVLENSPQGKGTLDTTNTGNTNWKAFFDDQDLLSLIDTAISNNKEIGIMMQRINTAENEIQERKGEYLPFVSLGVGAEVETTPHHTLEGAAHNTLTLGEGEEEEHFPKYLADYQFGLFASWEIDVWKKLRNSSRVAALEYMASKEGKNFLVTNLVAEIAHSYYELVSLDNHLMNLDQNIQLQQQGIEVIKQLIQYGRANLLALKRYEGEISKNKSKIYGVVQEIVEVENKINLLLGRVPQPIRRSSGGFLNIKPKMIQAGIPSQLLKNRPDIRQAELELTASKLNIDVARANFYPSLEIKAGYGYRAFQSNLLLSPESMALSLAGEIAAPVFNRSAIIANYKNADSKQIQAAYEYEQTIINAFAEVSNQLSNIDNLEKNYQQKIKQVKALNESIQLADKLFQSSRVEYLEVLLIQREALEANMELIETKQEQIMSTVDLYRVLGGGWQ